MFWDSSAIIPSLVPERESSATTALLRSDPKVTLWWVSPVECQSALYRRHREELLPLPRLQAALRYLATLLEDADVVAPTSRLRERAGRLLAAHPLRAADSLQLAAALAWCEEDPQGSSFVCLDERLREAAQREGFNVLPA